MKHTAYQPCPGGAFIPRSKKAAEGRPPPIEHTAHSPCLGRAFIILREKTTAHSPCPGRAFITAAGNQNFGYAGGGRLTPSAPYYSSKVDRIDYSNDTATAVAKGPLSSEKKHLAATGNTSFGYFGGGLNSSYDDISTIDRIDYSNDTATASPKGPLAYDADYLAATGYEDFGYFIGGHPSSPSLGGTYIQRVDYSNDTATAAQKGFMFNNSTAGESAFSAGANGLPQGPV